MEHSFFALGEGGSKLCVLRKQDRRGAFTGKRLELNRKSPRAFAAKFEGGGVADGSCI